MGRRAPAERGRWERAARGGFEGRRFAWGDALCDGAGMPRCNVFRGAFPNAPAPGSSPGPIAADAGTANGFGLRNVCGKVWEWCADARPHGQRALRGGSFLCHDPYCIATASPRAARTRRTRRRSTSAFVSSRSDHLFVGPRAARHVPLNDERASRPHVKEHAMFLGRLVTVAALAAGGYWLKKKMDPSPKASTGTLSFVEDSIEVDVPIRTAYDQWTQFEEFPHFMHDVLEVRQLDDTHLHWRARILGKEIEWDSEITTQIPDRRISWRSTSGPPNSGAVAFDRVTDNRTRITLRMSYRAPGIAEQIGDALGAVRLELSGNLHRFADFVQSRQRETGAWRGSVHGGVSSGDGAETRSGSASTAGSV